MLLKESVLIKKYLEKIRNNLVLNICSSDEEFYKVKQPYIWKNIHKPLINNNNKIINLDIKNALGVDIINNCKNMVDVRTNSIDVVLFFSGIEHVFNPKMVIKEIYRVLKGNGVLIASAPAVYPYHEDPIDNNLRFLTKDDWLNILGHNWALNDFEKSGPQIANPSYKFNKLVYSTVITAKKKFSDIRVDAVLLSYKREKNLKYVVRGLKRQSFINDIYIYHNYPSIEKINGAINIYSEKNFRCIIRHSLGLMLKSDYVLFIDDDIELIADFSKRFIDAIKLEPNSVIGLFGKVINKDNTKPYTNGIDISFSPFIRYVDIVKGRIHLIKKEKLLNSLDFIAKNLIEENMIEDDIILNLSNQLKSKTPSVLIPSNDQEIKNLNEDHALAFRKGHLNLRDNYINEFLYLGWKPKTHRGKFFNKNIEFGSNSIKDEQRILKIKNAIIDKNFLIIKKEFEKLESSLLLDNRELYNIAGFYRIKKYFYKAFALYMIVIKNDISIKKELSGLSYFHIGNIHMKIHINNNNAKESLKKCLELIPNHQKANELLKKLNKNAYLNKE